MDKTKFTFQFEVEAYQHNASSAKEEQGGKKDFFFNPDFGVCVHASMFISDVFQDSLIKHLESQMDAHRKIREAKEAGDEEKVKSSKYYLQTIENRIELLRKMEKSLKFVDVENKECVLCGAEEDVELVERGEGYWPTLYCPKCKEKKGHSESK